MPSMIDIVEFSNVFPRAAKQSYPMGLAEQVTNATKTLGEQLFFHLLLETLQIQASHLYPPRNAKDLQELHRHIVDAGTCREAVKQSLLFYLLKDCDANFAATTGRSTTGSQKSSQGESQQRRGRRRNNEETASKDDAADDGSGDWASAFAEKAHMPKVYALCMEGFWRLDRLDFKEAVAYLTHPSLIPQFTNQILYALLHAHQSSLALAYFNAWHLSLEEGPANLKTLFLAAKAQASLTDSFFFWRGGIVFESPEERKALLRAIVDSAIDVKDEEEEEGNRIQELVDLPFRKDEEALFTEILNQEEEHAGNLRRKDRKRRLDDVVILRDLAKFRYKDAASRIRELGVDGGGGIGGRWEGVLSRLREEGRV